MDKCIWDNVKLLSQVTREQPTKHLETNKFTNTPNLKNTMYIPQMNYIGNELTKKGIQATYISNANHLVIFFPFFLYFLSLFFCFAFFCKITSSSFFSFSSNVFVLWNKNCNYWKAQPRSLSTHNRIYIHTQPKQEGIKAKCSISSIPQ